ncbi:hypothetical protein [Burkholderia gladioli]|uniref:hypothetical protein n=1 Tax=Burkholderia gladioli TaxID=28095 RepID=UPI001C5D8D52|nr:hypothetical protein [Burkholderia gladioli]MBW5285974.1 hypothetical protein [Burkholderia gladioli]
MSESKQRLINAAFDHLNEMGGAAAGMVAIPSTTPQLFFVIGEKEQIAAMVGAAEAELVEALQVTTRAASDTLFVLQEILRNDGGADPRLENLAEALDKATDLGWPALVKAGAA